LTEIAKIRQLVIKIGKVDKVSKWAK
jgi:hypothetical protein